MVYLHIYTGEGKGKTTAAIGMAIRAAGAGRKVAFIQFDKGPDPMDKIYSERNILRCIDEIDLFYFGCNRLMPNGSFRNSITAEDKEEAQRALKSAYQAITIPTYFLVVLDEIITAVNTSLISEEELVSLIREYRGTSQAELVLTGRGASTRLIQLADLVTDMKNVKHFYQPGMKPRKGIEY